MVGNKLYKKRSVLHICISTCYFLLNISIVGTFFMVDLKHAIYFDVWNSQMMFFPDLKIDQNVVNAQNAGLCYFNIY